MNENNHTFLVGERAVLFPGSAEQQSVRIVERNGLSIRIVDEACPNDRVGVWVDSDWFEARAEPHEYVVDPSQVRQIGKALKHGERYGVGAMRLGMHYRTQMARALSKQITAIDFAEVEKRVLGRWPELGMGYDAISSMGLPDDEGPGDSDAASMTMRGPVEDMTLTGLGIGYAQMAEDYAAVSYKPAGLLSEGEILDAAYRHGLPQDNQTLTFARWFERRLAVEGSKIVTLRRYNAELVAIVDGLIAEWERQKGLFPELSRDGWMDLRVKSAKCVLSVMCDAKGSN